jgi:SAM-dependent methyltransferase
MKKRLLNFLICPDCKRDLVLSTQEEDEEIMEGELRCEQNHSFKILRGIPRFVQSDSYAGSFGFQWNQFSRVQLDSLNGSKESEDTFLEKTGFDRSLLYGKLILDAGVGAGRFSDVVSRSGGEVIGVDLSLAVESAFENVGKYPNVHIIQADLFRLPFKEKIFDFIFSIGVLHHTPNTHDAFLKLMPHLKEGGEVAIWVYDAYTPFKKITDTLRKISTRLPKKFVYYSSTIAIPLYYLKPLRKIFENVFRLCMHRNWKWRWLDTFDYFSPKYQWKHTYPEVHSWFEEAGLEEITPLSAAVSLRGLKPASNNAG